MLAFCRSAFYLDFGYARLDLHSFISSLKKNHIFIGFGAQEESPSTIVFFYLEIKAYPASNPEAVIQAVRL